jgi:hypothetical protein
MATNTTPIFTLPGQFFLYHFRNCEHDKLRMGQRFVNLYIKDAWPELFYCISDHESMNMILDWLSRNGYEHGGFPPQIGSGQA